MATEPTKRERNLSFFEGLNPVKEIYFGNIIYKYLVNGLRPAVALFSPKSVKPVYHYSFTSPEDAQKFIEDRKRSILRDALQSKAQEQQNEAEKANFKPDAVIVASWGYEQTNIDFYLILERKNDYLTIQEIGQDRQYAERYNDRGTVTPDKTVLIGEPMRKKITKHAGVKFESYKYGRLWDGKPEYFSNYA